MPKRRLARHSVTQPLDASYRLIPLTQNKNAMVDIGDFDWLNQWNWRVTWNEENCQFYAVRSKGRKNILMHRQIMGFPKEVDHGNRDGLDNRRENLRACTSSQNKMNTRIRKNSRTGFRGVHIRPENGRFSAQIQLNGKANRLGCFATAEEAARVYDKAAKELHGEFATLNFPEY
jgi:HNH endonuclease/AP2 domain